MGQLDNSELVRIIVQYTIRLQNFFWTEGAQVILWVLSCSSSMLSLRLPHDKIKEMACAPSKDSDQPGHPASLTRVYAVHSVGS